MQTNEEIISFIKNLDQLNQDEIALWLRAVKLNGLSDAETISLTLAMANSGKILDWEVLEPTLDKHSTGGIGDKVTLLFVPLVAAYGEVYTSGRIFIPKLSGRSLGITGGTIDKLESIPGFNTSMTIAEMKKQMQKIGIAICSTTGDLAPADKKLYAIRDVTNTIDSIPLIASSIMSKKIAGGAKNIILDVKFGSGAFMKSFDDAKKLAYTMVNIGKGLGKKVKAVITGMDQPLGNAVGNILEVKEVLDVMSGKKVNDLIEVLIKLASEGIKLIEGKENPGIEDKLMRLLSDGNVLNKFKEMVFAQGGDLNKGFKKVEHIEVLKSNFEGYISNIDASVVGEVVHLLGAGRTDISSQIDPTVGILFYKKYGDYVKENDPILEIHAQSKTSTESVKEKLISCIRFGHNKLFKLKLIYEVIG